MKRVAQFYKVSFGNYAEAVKADFPQYSDADIRGIYEDIRIPVRATRGSAGYDFFAPFSFTLAPGESIKIPTGIRVRIDAVRGRCRAKRDRGGEGTWPKARWMRVKL